MADQIDTPTALAPLMAARRSAFAGIAHPSRHGRQDGPAGVSVAERKGVALATVIARKDRHADLAEACLRTYGIALPSTPSFVAHDGLSFVWSGPGQWLAVAEAGHALIGPGTHALASALATTFAGLASVTDQSDARGMLRLSGPRIRDTLAKGLNLDLHDRSFKPGDAAMTWCSLIDVQLWQLDATPAYDLIVARGFAGSLWHWLEESAAEYGMEVA